MVCDNYSFKIAHKYMSDEWSNCIIKMLYNFTTDILYKRSNLLLFSMFFILFLLFNIVVNNINVINTY